MGSFAFGHANEPVLSVRRPPLHAPRLFAGARLESGRPMLSTPRHCRQALVGDCDRCSERLHLKDLPLYVKPEDPPPKEDGWGHNNRERSPISTERPAREELCFPKTAKRNENGKDAPKGKLGTDPEVWDWRGGSGIQNGSRELTPPWWPKVDKIKCWERMAEWFEACRCTRR